MIGDTLGTGAFSTVYAAIDERLDAPVAIKVLAENHALDPEVRERFLSEAQRLRRLAGSHVVAVHDVGETERRQPYFSMELAAGGDLETRVTALDEVLTTPSLGAGADLTEGRYRPTATEILEVAMALATSLGRAHRHGIVHRDVKPSNLLLVDDDPALDPGPIGNRVSRPAPGSLVGAEERLVLGDFGLAKELRVSSGLTVGAGTSGFAAPEQLVPVTTITPTVDVYGASAVMYWLYTRTTPGPRATWAGIPGPVARVLRRGLAARPEDRHRTLAEWHQALQGAVAGVGGATGWRRSARLWAVLFAVALGLVAAVVGLAGGFWWGVAVNGDDSVGVVTLDDGRQQVTATGEGVELVVTGPSRGRAGEPVRLEASTNSGNPVIWILPSGETSTGPALELRARNPGLAVVTIATPIADERPLSVDFDLTIDSIP